MNKNSIILYSNHTLSPIDEYSEFSDCSLSVSIGSYSRPSRPKKRSRIYSYGKNREDWRASVSKLRRKNCQKLKIMTNTPFIPPIGQGTPSSVGDASMRSDTEVNPPVVFLDRNRERLLFRMIVPAHIIPTVRGISNSNQVIISWTNTWTNTVDFSEHGEVPFVHTTTTSTTTTTEYRLDVGQPVSVSQPLSWERNGEDLNVTVPFQAQ